ncbi:MAG TPA: hypothetical protein VMR41_01730 [Patescibacteria group bacterium]|nr:hypothetical protein [Patescibacteria group bacterium]
MPILGSIFNTEPSSVQDLSTAQSKEATTIDSSSNDKLGADSIVKEKAGELEQIKQILLHMQNNLQDITTIIKSMHDNLPPNGDVIHKADTEAPVEDNKQPSVEQPASMAVQSPPGLPKYDAFIEKADDSATNITPAATVDTSTSLPYPKASMPSSVGVENTVESTTPVQPITVSAPLVGNLGGPNITPLPTQTVVEQASPQLNPDIAMPPVSIEQVSQPVTGRDSATIAVEKAQQNMQDLQEATTANIDQMPAGDTQQPAVNAYNFGPPTVSVANLLAEDDGKNIEFA